MNLAHSLVTQLSAVDNLRIAYEPAACAEIAFVSPFNVGLATFSEPRS